MLGTLQNIQNAADEKDAENEQLKQEIQDLEDQLVKVRDPNKEDVMFELDENQPQRLQRIMRRNRMIQKIKDQEEVMMRLQEQLDNYMHRSFPSLG